MDKTKYALATVIAAVLTTPAAAHSARKAHDLLHADGYHRVVLLDQRTNYDGQSNYLFQACRGERRYKIRVNWYGDIVSRRRAGSCYRNW